MSEYSLLLYQRSKTQDLCNDSQATVKYEDDLQTQVMILNSPMNF